MKLDAALPALPLEDVPAFAQAAEAFGFSGLWSSETQHDPFLPLALAAEHTARLELGTAIAVSFARSPATLAYTAWDLAAQSGGRFILGLGTQVKAHVERRFGMPWPDSVTGKLREQIQVIRALWNTWQSGAPLNFRGEYYKITLMSPFFNPGPIILPSPGIGSPSRVLREGDGGEGIPIYIAGVNTGLARLAGELCNGFLVHPFHTPKYLADVLLPAVDEGARSAARSRSDVVISATIFAASTAADRDYCRRQIAFYASTPSYRPVMDLHGWAEIAGRLSSLASRGQWEAMPALITDEMLATFAVLGDGNDLAAAIQERYRGLVDRLALYLPFVPGERDSWWRGLARAFQE